MGREFWHELGSNKRFKPRWWQRRAYVEGLRDAARIVEVHGWKHAHLGMGCDVNCRDAIKEIHERSVKFEDIERR